MKRAKMVLRPAAERDLDKMVAAAPSILPEGWQRPSADDVAWVMEIDGASIAAGGFIPWSGDAWWAWALLAPEARSWMHRVHLAVKLALSAVLSPDRVLTVADPACPGAMKWARALGFELNGDMISGLEVLEWRSSSR